MRYVARHSARTCTVQRRVSRTDDSGTVLERVKQTPRKMAKLNTTIPLPIEIVKHVAGERESEIARAVTRRTKGENVKPPRCISPSCLRFATVTHIPCREYKSCARTFPSWEYPRVPRPSATVEKGNILESDQKSESCEGAVPLASRDLVKRISLNPRRSINVTSAIVERSRKHGFPSYVGCINVLAASGRHIFSLNDDSASTQYFASHAFALVNLNYNKPANKHKKSRDKTIILF